MRKQTWFLVAALFAALACVVGCSQRSADQSATSAAGKGATSAATGASQPPAPSKVLVHAYINVTSGCQADTVALLDKLAAQYADCAEYKITDFGRSPGTQEWIASGIGCMGIQFNGSTAVALSSGADQRVVVFELPVGQGMWTHDDLRTTFEAIKAGSFRSASEQEVKDYLAPCKVEASVVGQKVENPDGSGGAYGQVVMDGQVVMTFKQPAEGKSPVERARFAATALRKWLSGKVLPTDIAVEELDTGYRILVVDEPVAVVTDKDAPGKDVPLKKVASSWAGALSHGVMVARARQKMAAAQSAQTKGSPGSAPGSGSGATGERK
jgi:hypothetical protein